MGFKDLFGHKNKLIGAEKGLFEAIATSDTEKQVDWITHIKQSEKVKSPVGSLNCRNAEGNTPLLAVIESGIEAKDKNEIINKLLEYKVDVTCINYQGETVLICMSKAKGIDRKIFIQVLIMVNSHIEYEHRNRNTVLTWVARNGHQEVAKVLIKAGANVNYVKCK